MKKTFYFLLIVIILSTLLLSSCKQDKVPPIEKIVNYMAEREYVRIYGYLSYESKQSITIDEFSTRFENIYAEMYINKMQSSITDYKIDDNLCTVWYDITFDTSKFGAITMSYEQQFIEENGDWKLIYSPSLIVPDLGENEKVYISDIEPKRGEIFDVNGNLLAKNDYAITVYVNVDKVSDGDALIRTAAPLLGVTEKYIKDKIQSFYDRLNKDENSEEDEEENNYQSEAEIVTLKSFSPHEGLPSYIKDQLLQIDGIGIDTSIYTKIRTYPYGQMLSHTLGYMGVISYEESILPENINLPPEVMVGKTGLEKSYELELRGTYGYRLDVVNEQGRVVATPVYKPAVDGKDIWISIDAETQIQTEMLLMEYLTDEMAGAVVALDPTTGQIVSTASYPTYDPNSFTFGISNQQWEELTNEESNNPLYNRATIGLYPPGSTFKPFTAAVAMDTNTLSYDFAIKEHISDNKWTPPNSGWVYPPITRVMATPGLLNMRNALIYSDNIYFAYAALKVGEEQFHSELERIGFNEVITTDITLGRPRITNEGEFGKMNLLADTGYGQGELLISPLQMASMFGVFANDGDIMKPYIVEKMYVDEGEDYQQTYSSTPIVWKDDVFTEYVIAKLGNVLRDVVDFGTAEAVSIDGINVYGKTGTAEIGNDKSREIAWFIGYVYYPEPLLVCVTLEVPAGEGAVRYNIARALLDNLDEVEE